MAEIVEVLTVLVPEATSTPLVVLQLETLVEEEIEMKLFNGEIDRKISQWLGITFHTFYS